MLLNYNELSRGAVCGSLTHPFVHLAGVPATGELNSSRSLRGRKSTTGLWETMIAASLRIFSEFFLSFFEIDVN